MEQLTFDGRVAIVTGAGGGLGRSHAIDLANRGALVVVNDVGGTVDGSDVSSRPADGVVEEIVAAGGSAIASYESVVTPEGGRAIVDLALDTFGRVDIIVNNAGILRDGSFKNMVPELVDPVLDVHLRGAFYVTQPAWAHMRDRGYGRIVNTSSGAGLYGNFGQANYGAAKMGLVGLTRVLAVEGWKSGIKVNAIAPIAKTRMTEGVLGDLADSLSPSQVTPMVSFLAHEACSVSGEVFSVGGGRVAQCFIGTTRGYFNPELTAEDVFAHLDEVRNRAEYETPAKMGDELKLLMKVMNASEQ